MIASTSRRFAETTWLGICETAGEPSLDDVYSEQSVSSSDDVAVLDETRERRLDDAVSSAMSPHPRYVSSDFSSNSFCASWTDGLPSSYLDTKVPRRVVTLTDLPHCTSSDARCFQTLESAILVTSRPTQSGRCSYIDPAVKRVLQMGHSARSVYAGSIPEYCIGEHEKSS